MPEDFTIEDFEASTATAADLVKAEDLKVNATGMPEELQGKSAAEIANMYNAAKRGLEISESARRSAESAVSAATSAREAAGGPARTAVEEPEISREDLEKMLQEKPLEALAMMFNMNNKTVLGHLDKRLGNLGNAASSVAERAAKAEYPLEFELFGKEIKEFTDQLTDKSALNSSDGWDNMISYIRGKKGNFEKYIEHKTKVSTSVTRDAARTAQADELPFTPSTTRKSAGDPGDLDDTSKKIADEFIASGVFKDYSEYKRWQKLG